MPVSPTRDRVDPEKVNTRPLRRPEWIKVRAPTGEVLQVHEAQPDGVARDAERRGIRVGHPVVGRFGKIRCDIRACQKLYGWGRQANDLGLIVTGVCLNSGCPDTGSSSGLITSPTLA